MEAAAAGPDGDGELGGQRAAASRDGRDDAGRAVPAGVCFARGQAGRGEPRVTIVLAPGPRRLYREGNARKTLAGPSGRRSGTDHRSGGESRARRSAAEPDGSPAHRRLCPAAGSW